MRKRKRIVPDFRKNNTKINIRFACFPYEKCSIIDGRGCSRYEKKITKKYAREIRFRRGKENQLTNV